MSAQRINQEFVNLFTQTFTEDISRKYQKIHVDNCHHWDYSFVLWHRKFVNQFWQEIGLERTYAVLTETNDRELYSKLTKSLVSDNDDLSDMRWIDDTGKLNSFTSQDEEQMRLEIAQAMASLNFAIDLDHEGSNNAFFRGEGGPYYNLSFSSQLEEFHDIIHGETGRGMRRVGTAGGDHCFFIHHTFVDLIFEAWLAQNPNMPLPISEEHFNATPDLQEDYENYEELATLWNERHYTSSDYNHVYRIIEPLPRQSILFESIRHVEDFRRVIMFHNGEEIGRFAILTGRLETCLSCARKEQHTGQFLLRKLVPLHEIDWVINRRWYRSLEEAIEAFNEIGMSAPVVVSF